MTAKFRCENCDQIHDSDEERTACIDENSLEGRIASLESELAETKRRLAESELAFTQLAEAAAKREAEFNQDLAVAKRVAHHAEGQAAELRAELEKKADRLEELEADCRRGMKIAWALTQETQTVEEACTDLVRMVRETRGPKLDATSNGEAGDYTITCSGCGEERDEPHTWAECHAVVAKQLESTEEKYWATQKKLADNEEASFASESRLRKERGALREQVKTLRKALTEAKGQLESAWDAFGEEIAEDDEGYSLDLIKRLGEVLETTSPEPDGKAEAKEEPPRTCGFFYDADLVDTGTATHCGEPATHTCCDFGGYVCAEHVCRCSKPLKETV